MTHTAAIPSFPTTPETEECKSAEKEEHGNIATASLDLPTILLTESLDLPTILPTEPADGKNEERKRPTRKAALQSALRDKRKTLQNKSGSADYTYCFGFTQITQWLATAAANLEPSSHIELSSLPAIQKAIYGHLFTQMTAQKGVKKHGHAAYNGRCKEFEHFRVMDVLEPLNAFELTDAQKAKSLRALSVIKEKQDGKLKGHTIADGSTQKGKYCHSRCDRSVFTRPHERFHLHAIHRMGC
jgi:hypothetical protein